LATRRPFLPSSIVNILGADGYSGEAKYEGLEEVLADGKCFRAFVWKKTNEAR
jgi:5-(carboxyamino)imidazole ribonucleotide synthase